jgi:hypothetical protein
MRAKSPLVPPYEPPRLASRGTSTDTTLLAALSSLAISDAGKESYAVVAAFNFVRVPARSAALPSPVRSIRGVRAAFRLRSRPFVKHGASVLIVVGEEVSR